MKRIRIFCLLALAVMCLTVMAGCGRQNNDGGNTSTDAQNGTDQTGADQTGDNAGATRETEWCTCEPGDHDNNNTDNINGTENGTENGTGGLLDDIGDGITDAVDDIGNAAGDVVDDLTGNPEHTTEGGNGGNTTENGTNRMR